MTATETAIGTVAQYDTLSPAYFPEHRTSRTSLLDLPPEESATRSIAAGAGAMLLHGGAIILALTIGARVTQRAAEMRVSNLIEVEISDEAASEEPEPEPTESTLLTKPIPPASPTTASERLDPPIETEEEQPPPAPAEAGEVLTSEAEVLDFGDMVISGVGDRFVGGLTSAGGTSKAAVRNGSAQVGGVVGDTGNDKPVRALRPVDHSRAPQLAGGMEWDCPFPPEAEVEQINQAVVSLKVQVAPDGKVRDVTVLSDPGYGFGREARRCAQRKRWAPGLDDQGQPTGATAHIKVRFQPR